MLIVQVCPEFPFRGGVERHVLEVSRRLRDLHARVRVVTCNLNGYLPAQESLDGIEVLRFRLYGPKEAYYFAPGIFRHLMKLGGSNTLIHAHNYQAMPAFFAAMANQFNRLPLVFTPHFHPRAGSWIRGRLKAASYGIGSLIFKRASVIIALSEYESSLIQQIFHCDSTKIHIIPHGTDRPSRKTRKRSHLILYVGRLEPYKGVDYLIQAMPLIVSQVPDAKLAVVGSGRDEQRLRQLARKLAPAGSIEFLGSQPDAGLKRLFDRAGVLALISEYEAFSLTVSEAIARGVPVVASKVGAIPEIYGKEQGCTLINYPPRIDELARVISKIISNFEFQTKENGGLQHTWDFTTLELMKIYEELV